MSPALLPIAREALLLALLVSAPALGAALLVGLLTGVAQAATQVSEPSLGVVPRLVAVLGVLAFAAPWIGGRLARFAADCLAHVAGIAP